MDSETLGNNLGYQCPDCKQGDNLQVVIAVWADLTTEGSSIEEGDHEFDSQSLARCECGWNGHVSDLILIELED